jgi:glycosyltransferase involved in cell wall biosynthesis
MPGPSASAPFGFNLIGFASANLGLGAALRNTAAVLQANGMPFCVLDVDLGDGRSGLDSSLRERFHPSGREAPYAVNLFHINPPELAGLLKNLGSRIPVEGRMNVCVPFWELPQLPPSWTKLLSGMDMVLAPSRFIQAALGMSLRSTPVRYYPQAIGKVPEALPDRARWGFAPGATVFLSSFDLSSDLQRKNPVAALLAFQKAFAGSPEALLVLKLNNAALNPSAAEATRRLKDAAQALGNARVLDRNLAVGELMSLYASADVFVSLHRAEGLGLSLMESMWLGKPVLCTDWSGNMDFCDDLNACLVGHGLAPVGKESAYFGLLEGIGQSWADPDVDEAADWMRKLARDPGLRREIGERAARSIRVFVGEAGRGEVFRQIEAYFRFRRRPAAPPAVLIQNRADMEKLPGGDTVVTRGMLAGLGKAGAVAVSLETSPDLGNWDIVQLVNISRTLETRLQMRHAKRAGKPIALLSLYEDFERYLVPAVKLALLYEGLAAEGRFADPESLAHYSARAALNMDPLEDEAAKNLGIGDKAAQQEILAGADLVLTSGRSERELLRSRFRFDAPVHDIPFGVDPELRHADGRLFAEKYGLRDFALCVGRLEARKNPWTLLEIFRQWPDKQLVMIGYFSSTRAEKAIKAIAPPNVRFLQKLPRAEIVSAYAAARVHVLPSWYELPGLVSLEAAAAGSRVVTTSWGTARDCLGPRVGYCAPDDPGSIRRAILEAWDSAPDPGLREYVLETYDWDKTAARLREVYRLMLAERGNREVRGAAFG